MWFTLNKGKMLCNFKKQNIYYIPISKFYIDYNFGYIQNLRYVGGFLNKCKFEIINKILLTANMCNPFLIGIFTSPRLYWFFQRVVNIFNVLHILPSMTMVNFFFSLFMKIFILSERLFEWMWFNWNVIFEKFFKFWCADD